MKYIVPCAEFLESSGDSGGMVFNVPLTKVKELGPIFSIMDKMNQQKSDKIEDKKIEN